jgi:hypothetical protein
MKFRNILLLLITLLGFSNSCSQTIIENTQELNIEVITIQITPELEHWMPRINQCAESIQGIGIYTEVLTQDEVNSNLADVVLRLGQKAESDLYVAVMGTEEIVIIRGRNIPINTLHIESLRTIYTGTLTNWRDVAEVKQDGIDIDQPIQTLSYPEGHILRELFSNTYLAAESIGGETIPYSTLEGLERALQEYPYGIAYLLKSQTPQNLEIIGITRSDDLAVQQYVLAVTADEPEGSLKQLLLCLQNTQNQQ